MTTENLEIALNCLDDLRACKWPVAVDPERWIADVKQHIRSEFASVATALTQKDEELAAYKAAHEKCVEDAVDESVRIHDEIEARRDGLEALVAQKDETIQQLQAEQGTVIEACAAYLDRNYGDEGAEFVAALRQQAWGPILPTPLQEPR
jgi:soluble cytochrome b562